MLAAKPLGNFARAFSYGSGKLSFRQTFLLHKLIDSIGNSHLHYLLFDIAEQSWKISARDRFSLLLACCKDCIGNVSVIPVERKEVENV